MKKRVDFKLYHIMITFVIVLLALSAILIDIVGYEIFTNSILDAETKSAYQTAELAATMVDADQLDNYLQSRGDSDEYRAIESKLAELCQIQGFSRIAVLKSNADFNEAILVFNIFNDIDTGDLTVGDMIDHDEQNNYRELSQGPDGRRTIVRDDAFNDGNSNVNSIIALKDADDNVVGMIVVQKSITGLTQTRRIYIIWVSSITLVLLVVAILIARFFIKKHIEKPLHSILAETQTFASTSTKNADHTAHSMVKELNSLVNSIDKIEDDTLQYIDNLTMMTKENERIGTELQLAHNIQQSALPNVFPAFPTRHEFDIYALMNPAKEIGGDFYDFYLIDDNHLALTIADVSGKGIPAALFMMNVKILLNEHALLEKTPAEILTAVNQRICQNNKNALFVTVWLGILELSTGNLIYTNAGHADPVIAHEDRFALHQTKHDLALGAMAHCQYHNHSLQLNKGDKLFVYTDGVTEATAVDGGMYGVERLLTTLNRNRCRPVTDILKNLEHDINRFVGTAQQFDDITMLGLKYQSDGRYTKTFPADTRELKTVLAFVNNTLAEYFDKKTLLNLAVSVEEVFTNIANYAYPDPKRKNRSMDLTITIDDVQHTVTLIFADGGVPFNPLDKKDPDITLPAAKRDIGGLGIFMTKQVMDTVAYQYNRRQNILTLTKKI